MVSARTASFALLTALLGCAEAPPPYSQSPIVISGPIVPDAHRLRMPKPAEKPAPTALDRLDAIDRDLKDLRGELDRKP